MTEWNLTELGAIAAGSGILGLSLVAVSAWFPHPPKTPGRLATENAELRATILQLRTTAEWEAQSYRGVIRRLDDARAENARLAAEVERLKKENLALFGRETSVRRELDALKTGAGTLSEKAKQQPRDKGQFVNAKGETL